MHIQKNLLFLFVAALMPFISTSFASDGFSENANVVQSTSTLQTLPTLDEKTIKSFNKYISVGAGLPGLPSVQFGCRWQNMKHGADVSLQIGTFVVIWAYAKIEALYLYFPHPDLEGQTYFGFGIGNNLLFNTVCLGCGAHHLYDGFSPEFVIGEQFETKNGKRRFIQGQISWPTVWVWKNYAASTLLIPMFSVSYGWMF